MTFYRVEHSITFAVQKLVVAQSEKSIIPLFKVDSNIIYRNAIDDECGFLPLYQRRIAIRNAQLRGKKYFIYMVKRMSANWTTVVVQLADIRLTKRPTFV